MGRTASWDNINHLPNSDTLLFLIAIECTLDDLCCAERLPLTGSFVHPPRLIMELKGVHGSNWKDIGAAETVSCYLMRYA